ncbi:hypothetical protein ACOSP6_07095 [Tenacibaculum sp. MEBiC06402]|uniref:hypothetical protein n=1 Tax=unclassified Tenacibaculum TaxID=2635139 RepID=UPI003B9BFE3E
MNSKDLNLVDQLAQGIIGKNEFTSKTSFVANYNEFKKILFSESLNVDKENNNSRFRNLFYSLPNSMSKEEEFTINSELLFEPWHNEHEELISGFQILFKDNDESVKVLKRAFLNIPSYINNIDESKVSYKRKIIYALFNQETLLKIDVLKELLNEAKEDEIKELIQRKLNTFSDKNKEKKDKPEIKLTNNSQVVNQFTLEIVNSLTNTHSIDTIDSIHHSFFSKGKWLIVLFAGYSGPDLKYVKEVLNIASDFPEVGFAFKPFMDDLKMKEFSLKIEEVRTTPIVLFKNDLEIKNIKIKPQEIVESLKSLLNNELL